MTANDLLLFARGPALAFSLFVLFGGVALRIIRIVSLGSRVDLAEPRERRAFEGALRGIFRRMMPRKNFGFGRKLGAINGYLYHVGLALLAFGYLPHIAFVRRLTGLSWPALPDAVAYVAAAFAVVALAVVLLERLTDPLLRLVSTVDDYFSWLVVFLPLVTGMAAIGGYSPAPAPAQPPYPMPLAIHLLSVELLFIWLPFGKLSHAFLVFMSRAATGISAARKGAAI